MSEKIDVNCQRAQCAQPIRRMTFDSDIKEPPSLDDVAADRRIHKACKQRHAADFGVCLVRIAPRLDVARCLEPLQSKAHQVKQRNRFHFVPRFQLEIQHRNLHGDCKNQQQVIA